MFEYLLSQADIPAYHVIGTDAGGLSWGLSAAVIDDSLFYFDIMSEYYVNGGEQLVYFGMTSQDLKNEGIVSAMYTDKTSIQEATDLYFDICRSCRSWEIQNGKLLVSVASGDIVELAL